jgi:hypothetical protein
MQHQAQGGFAPNTWQRREGINGIFYKAGRKFHAAKIGKIYEICLLGMNCVKVV